MKLSLKLHVVAIKPVTGHRWCCIIKGVLKNSAISTGNTCVGVAF